MSKTPSRLPTPVRKAASIDELRRAVTDLGSRGTLEVDAVRDAFTAGIAPLQTVSSGSVASFVQGFGGRSGVGSRIVTSTSQLGVNTAVVGTVVGPPRPELDFVEVGNDPAFGVLDSFYTRVVASLSVEDVGRVSYLRIMRAPGGRTRAPRPAFSAMIDNTPLGIKTKSFEYISNNAFRAGDVGIGNALTRFVVDDPFTKQRAVVSSGTLRPLPAPTNTNRRGSDSALVSIANADRSVLDNVRFYVNQRTMSPVQPMIQPLVVAQRQGINVLQGSAIGGRSSVIEEGNSAGFYEVSRIPVTMGRTVGAFVEIEYFDPSVVYGSSYTYYVVAVTRDGTEGPRSRLARVDISRFRPPSAPRILYGVVAGFPRFSAVCSGSFVDHIEVFRKGGVVPEAVRVLSTREAMVDEMAPAGTDSGFFHIGDVGVGVDRSATYVDRAVAGGNSLEYRFYTVDSFGVKSPTPFSCSLVIPDHGASIPLALPSITAEQAPGGRVVNVSVRCDDPRVSSFVIGRRELLAGENAYRQPTQPDYVDLGIPSTAKRARSRVGPRLNPFSKKAWSGILSAVSGAASFSDLSVQFDRRYQYSVYAVDIRGNKTSNVPAPPIFVAVKPVSDAPVAVTGTVISDGGIQPTGVMISWSGGTLDFSPNDLIGDQDVLFATSQRTVYQVERRLVGKSTWDALPATTATFFVDPVSTDAAPKFRPPYALPNLEYDYRVIAMQSGAFLSTHTDPVRVIVSPELFAPPAVWLRSTPTSVRPVHVVISWQYSGRFIDGWEVERAVTNKIYGTKISSMDSPSARSLRYEPVADVMRESSRGHGISVDPTIDPKVFVGNRFYVDQDVDLANSYFYRVRAFDAAGRFSGWTYGGIALTDSPHDRKLMSALSDDEKAALALDPRPIAKWRNG